MTDAFDEAYRQGLAKCFEVLLDKPSVEPDEAASKEAIEEFEKGCRICGVVRTIADCWAKSQTMNGRQSDVSSGAFRQ